MRIIAAEIEIEAPVSLIWDVISDLDSYADWNPFLPLASGSIVEGERIEVFIKPPRAKGHDDNSPRRPRRRGQRLQLEEQYSLPRPLRRGALFHHRPHRRHSLPLRTGRGDNRPLRNPDHMAHRRRHTPRLRKNERGPKGSLRSPPQPSPRPCRNALTT